MRVETREPEGSDVRARVDASLEPGEIRRTDDEIRVGVHALPNFHGLRTAAALAAREVRRGGGTVAWRADTPDEVRAVVEGAAYGAYDAGLHKQQYGSRELTLAVAAPAELHGLVERQARIMEHVAAARDLANRPPNDLTPVALAAHAKAQSFEHLTVESFGREWIEAQEMGAFAGVARGSAEEPQLIVMRYEPPTTQPAFTLGLVGKAVTFDSGGISLKPALRMQDMKGDMAGGGAVIEATAAIADLGLPVRVLAVVASTENVQGGSAYKPGDILRASNGKTIEIMNTDAEGRLILADALAYARSHGATPLIDCATLTGAMSAALGDTIAGWFANDDDWAAHVQAACDASGDLGLRFPLHPRYRRYIDSTFTDMKNGSDLREGGPVLAAMFLQEFSGEGPWAHVDMAGPGYVSRKRPDYVLDEGGTGYGVRLIVELAQRFA